MVAGSHLNAYCKAINLHFVKWRKKTHTHTAKLEGNIFRAFRTYMDVLFLLFFIFNFILFFMNAIVEVLAEGEMQRFVSN